MQFNPGDYKIEQLRYAKDFKIYPPVDANFKYETLSDDTIVQDMPRPPHYINKRPGINKPPNYAKIKKMLKTANFKRK
jgi:hypothetical protein